MRDTNCTWMHGRIMLNIKLCFLSSVLFLFAEVAELTKLGARSGEVVLRLWLFLSNKVLGSSKRYSSSNSLKLSNAFLLPVGSHLLNYQVHSGMLCFVVEIVKSPSLEVFKTVTRNTSHCSWSSRNHHHLQCLEQ